MSHPQPPELWRPPPSASESGFSLVELAIVLIIVALLSGGMLVTLSTSRDIARASDAQKQLAGINDALLGFAAANGRLPCPAQDNSTGDESFCNNDASVADCGGATATVKDHGRCSNPFDGFLPAKTLGITPTDAQGYAVDPWNNRVRYAVSSALDTTNTNFIFTGKDTIKSAWSGSLPDASKMLRVCSTATGATGAGASRKCHELPAPATTIADKTVAVIFSRGPNGATAPTSADEIENGDNNRLFVSTTSSANFDDVVSWLSPNLVYNRMISSGRLP